MKEPNTNIATAIKFIKNYKKFFKLDEDDIQDILIKFIIGYNQEQSAVSTFLVLLINNHNSSKWKKAATKKHSHISIKLDKVIEDDDAEWLQAMIANDDHLQPDIDEDKQVIKDKITKAMSTLKENEQYVLNKIYFDEITTNEIATQMGCKRQWVSAVHKRALKKLNKFFTNI